MNRMGYDAATPGNHEFDFGLDAMVRTLHGALFPYVSANIIADATGRTVFPASTVVMRAGIRIGITGVTTPGVMAWDGSVLRGHGHVAGVAQAGPPALQRLRARSDVTVLLAARRPAGLGVRRRDRHPAGERRRGAARGRARDRRRHPRPYPRAPRRHDHRARRWWCSRGRWPSRWPWCTSPWCARAGSGRWRASGARWCRWRPCGRTPPSWPPSPRQHAAVRAWVRTPLGQAATPLRAAAGRREDTPLLDFVNAVMLRQAGAQLSATAVFDTAAELAAGPVRLGDLARVYPYENTLKAVRISGADLRAYLEWSARYWRGMGPAGPVVNDSVAGADVDVLSGADYRLDLAQPVGRRVVALSVGGRPVGDRDSFTLALNNYRAGGGGGYAMLARAPVVYDRGEDIRELLAAEVRQRGTIRAADYFQRNWEIVGCGRRAARFARPPGARDQRLPRRAAPARPELEQRPPGRRRRRHRRDDDPARGRVPAAPTMRVDAGDVMQGTPDLQPLLRPRDGRGVQRDGLRRLGDRQPRVRLDAGHAGGADAARRGSPGSPPTSATTRPAGARRGRGPGGWCAPGRSRSRSSGYTTIDAADRDAARHTWPTCGSTAARRSWTRWWRWPAATQPPTW